jgi:hypothetical protein
MTIFERAKLRLFAFFLLDGWGSIAETKEGEWRAWDMEQRRDRALQLVEWAMAEDEPEQKDKPEAT